MKINSGYGWKTLVVMMLAAAFFGGCNIIAVPIVLFTPPKKVKAEFVLPKDARVLVLAESAVGRLSNPSFRMTLAEQTGDILFNKYLVDSVVPASTARSVIAQADRHYSASASTAPLDLLAGKTNADIVIYLEIRSFQISEHESVAMWSPKCQVAVKVVDASGKQLWPEGFNRMRTVTASVDARGGEGQSRKMELTEQLSKECADKIAKLFHDYRVPRY